MLFLAEHAVVVGVENLDLLGGRHLVVRD